MIVELDREDLVSLVRGMEPSYDIFEDPLVKRCGSWTGGFVEKWDWNSELDRISETYLFALYKLCKSSRRKK